MELPALVILIGIWSVEGKKLSMKNPCILDVRTCSQCILTDPRCAWCSGEISGKHPRCGLSNEIDLYCSHVEPSSIFKKRFSIYKKKTLRPKRPIRPQRIQMSLRKGISATIPFEVLARKETVKVKVRHTRSIRVVVKSDCKGFKWENKMAICTGVTPGKIKLRVVTKMKKCLPKPKIIRITVDGNRKQSLKIKVTSICSCKCEKVENIAPLSNMCSGHGDKVCGGCKCKDGYYGSTCECDASLSTEEAANLCIFPGNNSICSWRGDCICGRCQCLPKNALTTRTYSGKYCECDDYSCEHHEGEQCGGMERGICKCGVCHCKEGYEGKACESTTGAGCVSPVSGSVCNGIGPCVNDRCLCITGHGGSTCEGDCLGDAPCPGVCMAMRPCVECFAYGEGALNDKQCHKRCGYMRQMAEFVEDVGIRERVGPVFRMCMFSDEEGCFFKFSYNFNVTDRKPIKLETIKMC